MSTQRDQFVDYKWDANTISGYRLRYDAEQAHRGLQHCFHLEEWEHCCIVDDWGCDTVEEAVGLLRRFFEVDVLSETELLRNRFERVAHAA